MSAGAGVCESDVVRCNEEGDNTIALYARRLKVDLTPFVETSRFSYDHVYDETVGNACIYGECCKPLLEMVRTGGNAVIFAFGQTGSGKTYTMLGCRGVPGLYELAMKDLFKKKKKTTTVSASFYEVYGTKLYDLLNGRAELRLLQDDHRNVHLLGLMEHPVRRVDEVTELMRGGQQLRATGTTRANDRSSRSHAVLEIKLRPDDAATEVGRLIFVDLAGSERAAETADANAQTRREGAEINRSLLALKECIRAMSMQHKHIPFRGSKLTQILRESFISGCRTCVIATVSPRESHCEDTLNTLRYANRIRGLKRPMVAIPKIKPATCRDCSMILVGNARHVCLRRAVECPHCHRELPRPGLEDHLQECLLVPLRCPHCHERMVRGSLDSHSHRCPKHPISCKVCGEMMTRHLMAQHVADRCATALVKCRFCRGDYTRRAIVAHECVCEAQMMACPYCLKYLRRRNYYHHVSRCVLSPNSASAHAYASVNTIHGAADEQKRDGAEDSERPPYLYSRSLTLYSSSRTDCSPSQSPKSESGGDDAETPVSSTSRQSSSSSNNTSHSSKKSFFCRLRSRSSFVTGKPSRRSPGTGLHSSVRGSTGEDPTRCPYARYGCSVKITPLNLSAHLEEAVVRHLEMMMSYVSGVELENSELRRLVVETERRPSVKAANIDLD